MKNSKKVEKKIIRIRRGTGDIKYCACDSAGRPIQGFRKLSDIRKYWEKEIRWGYIELIRELDKKPDWKMIDDTIELTEKILGIYKK